MRLAQAVASSIFAVGAFAQLADVFQVFCPERDVPFAQLAIGSRL